MAYVYILRDKNGRYYTGGTTDIDRRFRQHLHGHTRTTRNMDKLKLVLDHKVESLPIARDIERKLKNMKNKNIIKKIVQDGYIKIRID